jgi:hypothetical protein
MTPSASHFQLRLIETPRFQEENEPNTIIPASCRYDSGGEWVIPRGVGFGSGSSSPMPAYRRILANEAEELR